FEVEFTDTPLVHHLDKMTNRRCNIVRGGLRLVFVLVLAHGFQSCFHRYRCYTRSMYSPERVSILSVSPSLTNSGTFTTRPVSIVVNGPLFVNEQWHVHNQAGFHCCRLA